MQCVARGEFLRGERAVRARVAANEFAERIFAGGEEDFGEAGRERSAESVAVAAGVFDGDEAGFAGDSNANGAACIGEIGDGGCDRGRGGARGDFRFGEVAVFEEQVVDAIGVAGLIVGLERLEAAFDFVDGVLVEEFAEIGVAENFLELRLVDRESLGAAFGERGVAVVDVIGDVGKEERGGEGRGFVAGDAGDADFAALNGGENVGSGGEIEDIADAFAIGLEKDRERREARSDGEKIGGAFALLPERSALPGAAARQKERARRGFAEFCGEERSRAELLQNELLEFGGIGEKLVGGDFFVAFGNAKDEAVVGPHRFDFESALGAQFGADGHAPRRVDASAERSENADAAVAEFVAAGFDDDVLIVGDAAGGDGLIFEIAEKIFGGVGVEAVIRDERAEGDGARLREKFARHGADFVGRIRRGGRRCRRARRAFCQARRERAKRERDRARFRRCARWWRRG